MVIGVVGLSGILFDDDPFRIPRASAYFWIHIVLAIVTARQSSFTILKRPAADISREGVALMLLNGLQQVFSFLRGGLRDSMQWSIERRRGILKSRPCALNGWGSGRRHGRFRRRAGVEGTREDAEQ